MLSGISSPTKTSSVNGFIQRLNPDSKVCWGDVVTADKPSKLVYSFTITPLGGATTTVNWHLEAAAGGTRLTLVHEGIGEAAGEAALGLLSALDKGWDEHFSKLRGKAVA